MKSDVDIICSTHRWPISSAIIEQWSLKLGSAGRILIGIDGGGAALIDTKRWPAVDVEHFEKAGANAIRNQLVDKSSAYALLFLDDDSYVESGLIADAVEYLQDAPDVAILTFPITLSRDGSYQARPMDIGTRERTFIGCGALIRRDVYCAAGGFPVWYGYCMEESFLSARCMQLGYKTVHYPHLKIIHHQVSQFLNTPSKLFLFARNKLFWDWEFTPIAILPFKVVRSFFVAFCLVGKARSLSPLKGVLSALFRVFRSQVRSGFKARRMTYAEFFEWNKLP